jgi:PAS domain S-box-containing protein
VDTSFGSSTPETRVHASQAHLPLGVFGALAIFCLAGAWLLAMEARSYPNLHTILDAGMALFSGLLSLLLWDVGRDSSDPLPKCLALSFTLTCVLEAIHVAVTVDWFGLLAPIAAAENSLRPATWPPAAYVLPIGVGYALWLANRGRRIVLQHGLVVAIVGGGLFLAFQNLPPYAPPGFLGITRPTLILPPVLWVAVGVVSWRGRNLVQLFKPLALMAAILTAANTVMLYSTAPADPAAMVAHLGKVIGYATFLLSLMQLASMNMRARTRMEAELSRLNLDLEHRVMERTVQIEAANVSLRRSEARFRQALEATPNALLMINSRGLIEMVNGQTESMFGHARAALLGHPVEMLVPDRFRGGHPGHRTSFYADPQSRPMGAGRDLNAMKKDGSEFPVEIGLNPIETDAGTMVLAAVVDISDRKREEQRLRAALSEKDVLLGEIHHRVKNNLQIVHSLLDLQTGRVTDPTAIETLRESQNRIKSMALIHQLLYQSRDFAEVDFKAFLDTLIPSLVSSYAMEPDHITISIETADVFLPLDAAVPCGLIANELITNALKHGFPDDRRGQIRVQLEREVTGQATFVVSDDGIGIPEDLVVEDTVTFGLQLVMLLAEQLGGKLAIQRSAPTRFLLRFPMQRSGT